MIIRIDKPIQGGTVKAIPSKSEAHRLLICAALSDRETIVECSELSEDIEATACCLESLGATINHNGSNFHITPLKILSYLQPSDHSRVVRPHYPLNLNCGESGATLRFLLPLCGALGLPAAFNMRGRLPERPLGALEEQMISHGCTLSEAGQSPLTCKGQLKSGTYTLPGNVSSQFVSGLLMALPLLSGESVISLTNILESRPYVDMTLEALRLFGMTIYEENAQTFIIPGGQKYSSPVKAKAGGDWSNAAFWLSAGAIGGQVTCTGLDLNSRQGDRAIVELLADFGAHVKHDMDTVTVIPGILRGIEVDAADIPDLVPVLAAVAATAEGKTIIRNAGRLRIKESNRLRTVTMLLSALGANITETEDSLVIIGREKLAGGEIESFGDHRIAMTAAILSASCSTPVVVHGAEAVKKSYPGFFDDFHKLGGECKYI